MQKKKIETIMINIIFVCAVIMMLLIFTAGFFSFINTITEENYGKHQIPCEIEGVEVRAESLECYKEIKCSNNFKFLNSKYCKDILNK